MKGYIIPLSLVVLLSLCNLSLSAVICDAYSACPDGYQCCKASSTYTCCPQSTTCSADGRYCYAKNRYPTFMPHIQREPRGTQQSIPSESFILKATPKDILVLADSFLETIGFYEYCPETAACGKNLSALVPDVLALIEKIKGVTKPEEIIQIAIEAYTVLLPKIQEAIKECPGVPAELKEKFAEIVAKVKEEGFIMNIIATVQKRFPEIFINVQSAVSMFQYGNFKQAGRNAGLALAILLNID